jgi:adenine-specific DNA-methyltransferase
VREGKHPWWALHRPRDPAIFSSPKLIGLTTTKAIEIVYDEDGSFTVTDAMYVLKLAAGEDPWAFMAVMQSSLMLFLYQVANQGESRVIPQIKATKLDGLPYPRRDSEDVAITELGLISKLLHDLHEDARRVTSPQEKAAMLRHIGAVEKKANSLVYALYDLTLSEIRTVDEALAVAAGYGRSAPSSPFSEP